MTAIVNISSEVPPSRFKEASTLHSSTCSRIVTTPHGNIEPPAVVADIKGIKKHAINEFSRILKEAKRKRDALRNTADQCKRDALRNTADQTGRDALCNTADQTGSGTPFATPLIGLEERKTYKPGDGMIEKFISNINYQSDGQPNSWVTSKTTEKDPRCLGDLQNNRERPKKEPSKATGREFQTSRFNELKARTKEKQWTVALSDIADWPRIEAVAKFRLRTGHECLAKTVTVWEYTLNPHAS
ncbi:unnamed protein product [Rodentolepis nana]|uniref:Kinesin motor domain-containing protein n=1 Tax=Rodentolepis nana TaxID=102285 RepID=A0A0R3TBV2_RODNA|nr:unnamed protein product [Rodentolepis nana]